MFRHTYNPSTNLTLALFACLTLTCTYLILSPMNILTTTVTLTLTLMMSLTLLITLNSVPTHVQDAGIGSWTQIPGKLKQVAVGQEGSVWGVNANDNVYYRVNRDGTWRHTGIPPYHPSTATPSPIHNLHVPLLLLPPLFLLPYP